MILVFILFGLAIFLCLLFCIIFISTLRIEIKEFYLSNMPLKNKTSYKITISLYLRNTIKWISFSINEEKIEKIMREIPFLKIDINKIEQSFKWKDLNLIKKICPKISYLNLEADLGFKSPITTALIVASINSVFSILLPHITKSLDTKKYKYIITPIYENRNLYKIKLNCIIELKMVHIINIIYIFIKKGKSDANERTTSNRKSYGYSYE